MIRILVADDHPVVREGLKRILADLPDLQVVAEASNCEETLAAARKIPCDVVLLDISMPGRGGLEVLRLLREELPGLPVLVLTVHPEDGYALRVLKAGASGFLNKESAPDHLVEAIRKVVSGGRYVSTTLAEILAVELTTSRGGKPHERLSDREFQVLCRIAAGRTVSEIAQELLLSVKTVSTYRTRLLIKMGAKNNAELTRYAIKHELAE